MIVNYLGTKINYSIVGNGRIPIVFLHGWGGSQESFLFICKYLKFDYRAMFIDFPPFGKSKEPKKAFTIFDYANIVKKLIVKENFNNSVIVGHSFGGRVAIILASSGYARSLILTASAGIKPKRNLKYYFRVYSYKVKKLFNKNANGGSKDYKKLSSVMKKTFINVVNEYLEPYAKKITCPTILFWGKKDKDTPLYMAKKLKKLIKDSALLINKNSGHFCYLQDLSKFVAIINYMGV